MGIKIDITADTPLSDDDRDILAGLSVMMLAIANRQSLADQAQQEQDLADVTEGMEPPVCADLDGQGNYCVREAGHSGRHKYRPTNGLMNRGDFRHLPPEIVAASWDRSPPTGRYGVWRQ